MLNAADIMTKEVITVKKDTSLADLARILYENRINGAPVVDDEGALEGVICESDLIRKKKQFHIPTVVAVFDVIISLERPKNIEKEIQRISSTIVEELYTKEVVTVNKNTPVDEIATIMTSKKIYTIPVMDGDHLVGIIGKADLIRTILA
ncbi:MAG: CBS domain-containing protein [Deltaproteobacteria bacterium]|nr:CBS domain-containing protein [Deltaproteobacteria bacterium]